MPEDVVGASLSINLDGLEGNVEGGGETNELLSKILNEIKNLNTQSNRREKESKSGIFGGAGGGASSGLLSGAGGAIVGGLGAGLAGLGGNKLAGELGTRFADILDPTTGERRIAEIDNLNNEIVDILTVREAEERGILDESGKIRGLYQATKDQILATNRRLELNGNSIVASGDLLERIQKENKEQLRLDEAITEAKRKILAELGGGALRGGTADSVNSIVFDPTRASDTQRKQQEAIDKMLNEASQSSILFLDDLTRGPLSRLLG